MKSKTYTAGRVLSPWAGIIGYALSLMFLSGWAVPIIIGCIWLSMSLILGEAICASATDTRQQRYRHIREAQQK
jgi:hypothetical protein